MYIALSEDGSITLVDHQNFGSFKIVDHGRRDLVGLREVLGDVAVLHDDTTAWVRRAAVPPLVPGGALDAWLTQYDAMLSKAAAFGWIDAATGAVKAHIERAV